MKETHMSDPESFLARWSALKRAAAAGSPAGKAATQALAQPAPQEPPAGTDSPAPAADLAALPPLESIGSASDICAFLQAGVPPELTRDALRRAWQTDPAIRDFIGLADCQWDFTAQDAIPGFGCLGTAEAARLAAQALAVIDRSGTAVTAVSRPPPSGDRRPQTAGTVADPVWQAKLSSEAPAAPITPAPIIPAAPVENPPHAAPEVPPRRSHGGALPR
jgi:hypothetical protein